MKNTYSTFILCILLLSVTLTACNHLVVLQKSYGSNAKTVATKLENSNYYFRQVQLLLSHHDEELLYAICQEVNNSETPPIAQADSLLYYIRTALEIASQQADDIQQKNLTIILLIVVSLVITASFALLCAIQRRKMKRIKHAAEQHETKSMFKKATEKQTKEVENSEKTNEISQRLIPEIERLLNEEKVYKQPGLAIEGMAKMLHTNRKYLSTAIRDYYQKSFPDLINTFRVGEAIQMFKESCEGGKYANYTIQAIGEEVGFNGKTTFYNAFKQIVGIAPSEYLKMLKRGEGLEHYQAKI